MKTIYLLSRGWLNGLRIPEKLFHMTMLDITISDEIGLDRRFVL